MLQSAARCVAGGGEMCVAERAQEWENPVLCVPWTHGLTTCVA